MISDRSLLKLSAIVAVIGIIILLITVQFVKPQKYEIMEIRDDMIGKAVTITGVVYSISEKNGNVFLNLYDGTGNIDVVAFRASVNVTKSQNATVSGKVAVYNNKLEIIANEIK